MTAELLPRLVARHLDLLVAGALALGVPRLGPILAVTYTLLADGFPGGQSLGKRLTGLRVVRSDTRQACGYRESVLRNLDIAMVVLFASPSSAGWFFALVLGGFVLGYELFLVATDEEGLRIGDLLADTRVRGAGPKNAISPAG